MRLFGTRLARTQSLEATPWAKRLSIDLTRYRRQGLVFVSTADEIFERAELIVKVKEPLASERKKLRGGQMIFTYLHLAPDPEQTRDLMASGVTAIANETVTDAQGKLPLLAPMSAVAGRMAPQVAAHFLERPHGGRGLLLGGIGGAPSAKTIILGGGVVARNAATVALGMGADGLVEYPTGFDREAKEIARVESNAANMKRRRQRVRHLDDVPNALQRVVGIDEKNGVGKHSSKAAESL